MQKSALTVALSGEPQKEEQTGGDINLSLLADSTSFPCLFSTEESSSDSSETDDTSDQMLASQFNIESEFMGTDYPLHPQKRRGGKEVDPGTFWESGLGSIPEYYGRLRANYLTEEIIGSLPEALSQQQKAEIISSTALSPSAQLVLDMGPSTLSTRSKHGKIARRSILKGSVMVFVTAGSSGKRFIYGRAKQLGVRSIIIDGPDSWSQYLAKEGVIEKFISLDMTDADSVFERCMKALKSVQSEFGQLDGVLTFCELAVPLVSRLAEQLGLPCNTSNAVDSARNKFKTREAVEAAGLPCPRHYQIKSKDQIEKAQEWVGFPAVIKPIFGAASIGVVRVNSSEELMQGYKNVIDDLEKARVVAGALVEGKDEPEAQGDAKRWIDLTIMMEEYLDGAEIDCDLAFNNGECVYGSITDNWPTIEPYFNETGSNCPSVLPQEQQKQLIELSIGSVKALGLTMGVFHVECKYTSKGPRLIEVNCRMGGGPVRDTNLLVWGVDLVEEQLYASGGIPSRPIIAHKPRFCIAEYTMNANTPGTLEHDRFLEHLEEVEGIIYARPLVKGGQRVVCVEEGLPTWVAELMVHKPFVQEAITYIKQIVDKISVPII